MVAGSVDPYTVIIVFPSGQVLNIAGGKHRTLDLFMAALTLAEMDEQLGLFS